MRVSGLFTAAFVLAALSFFAAGSVAAQSATQSEPILKPAKERGTPALGPEAVASTGTTTQRRLSLCVESWKQTHMSKREWRVACERSVKDYPDAFAQ